MRAAVIALGVIAAAIGAERAAEACSWAPDQIESRTLMPHDGATDVPTNARVVVEYKANTNVEPALEMRAANGDPVAVSVAKSRARWITYVLTPEAELQPNTGYQIWDDIEVGCVFGEVDEDCRTESRVVGSFTTGDAADLAPPTVEVVTVSSHYDDPGEDTTCDWDGAQAYDVLTVEGIVDDNPVEWVRFYYYEMDGTLIGGPFPVATVGRDCSGAYFAWYDIATPDRFLLRAVDLAGNLESPGHEIDGMSCEEGAAGEEDDTDDGEDSDSGGCRTGRGDGGLLLLLLLAVLARRQGAPRCSASCRHR